MIELEYRYTHGWHTSWIAGGVYTAGSDSETHFEGKQVGTATMTMLRVGRISGPPLPNIDGYFTR